MFVNMKFANWIESGGTRCIAVKHTACRNKLNSLFQNLHGLVIPSYGDPKICAQFIEKVIEVVWDSKEWNNFPILIMGESGISFLNAYLQKVKHK